MSKKDLEAQNAAPKRLPKRLMTTLSGGPNTVELQVEVSDNNGVENYRFAFGGVPVPVPVPVGIGKFHAGLGDTSKRLEWFMWGEPGGTMKVTVTRGDDVIRQRDASQIVPPETRGYDYFNVAVS
jgi:hypothetical protein